MVVMGPSGLLDRAWPIRQTKPMPGFALAPRSGETERTRATG